MLKRIAEWLRPNCHSTTRIHFVGHETMGLTVEDLGRYNSEVGRGIVHTPEWRERMAAAQAEFNYQIQARHLRALHIENLRAIEDVGKDPLI